MFTIRQATYTDKPALAEFLTQAYPGRQQFKYPERWEWAYEKNPFLADPAPPVWIAINEDGRIIGQCNSLIEPILINGKSYRAGWGVDFYVLEEFRGQGIGSELQAANNANNEVFLSVSMAKAAARIKKRMGMMALPEVPEFTKIVNHSPESVRYGIGLPLPGLLTTFLTKLLNWRNAHPLRKYTPPINLTVKRAFAFDERFDQLWERVSPKFNALVKRDARYLDWKFHQQPHTQREVFTAQRSNQMTGYLILRASTSPERNTGILLDLFCDPNDEDTIRALLHHGTAFLKEAGVTYITAASSVPAYQHILHKLGYKVAKTAEPLIRGPVEVPLDGWLIGKGDHDWDQYPLA